MNRSSFSSSYRNNSSISSSNGPFRAPTPIVPLRVIHDNEPLLVNDISSVLSERDVDHLHDTYQIFRDTF